uniref:Putative salivary kunitz domain protein n=1 Tax=Ixodes ricinus TaxID=34613 RepID=A0A0K8RFF9_IXORI
MLLIFVVSLVIMACIVVGKTGKKLKQRNGLNPNCSLEKNDGPCRAMIPRFYFDNVTRTCHRFLYGGCGR